MYCKSDVLVWFLVCLILTMRMGAAAAGVPQPGDLRDLRVGMSITDIPADEYTHLACAAAPSQTLGGFGEFAGCPADADGLHLVLFRYNDELNPRARINDKFEGTTIAGHPVLLALAIDDQRHVAEIRIDTDPKARLYLRKKAFLLALTVKARFGDEGWSCQELQPADGEEPVGGIFIKEHCEKTADGRRFVLDRALYRRAGQSIQDFVSGTHLKIRQIAESIR